MAHSNLGKAAGDLLTATEVNRLWADDGSDNFETDGILSIDTISEQTGAAGVTIDSVVLKDGGATLTGNLEVDSNTLFVDVSVNKVGVGTNAPDSTFEVQGGDVGIGHSTAIIPNYRKLTIGGATTGSVIDMFSQTTLLGRIEVNSTPIFQIEAAGATTSMSFRVNAATRMLIDTSGNVGVGKTPTDKLSIDLATEDLDIVDAGSTGATEQDWIEVKVGGNTGYIRVFATK